MQVRDEQNKSIPYAIGGSIAIHALLFLLLHFTDVIESLLFANTADYEVATEEPIVLEFDLPDEAPPSKPESPHIPETENQDVRVVDNPEADNENPDFSDLLAEHASISAAPDIITPQNSPVPFLEAPVEDAGAEETDEKEVREMHTPEKVIDLDDITALSGTYRVNTEQPAEFSKELLAKSTGDDQVDALEQKLRKVNEERGLMLFQKKYQASKFGPYRMSTYAWEWAPWFRDFEKAFWANWIGPPGYAMLLEGRSGVPVPRSTRSPGNPSTIPGVATAHEAGLLDGITLVRLKINPQGEKLEFEFIEHKGHQSIKNATLNAFERMFPTKALPDHFPDEYLEMWIKVEVPNFKDLVREYRQQQRRKNGR